MRATTIVGFSLFLLPVTAFAQSNAFFQIPGWTQAWGISADGHTVVGHSPSGAVAWNLPAGTQTLLGPGSAYSVSGDGSVIAGADVNGGLFRWTQATGPAAVGTALEDGSLPSISADGSTIVGITASHQAFRARTGTGIQTLPLPAGASVGGAYRSSADGSVIVGAASVGTFHSLPVIWNGLTPSVPGPLAPIPDASFNAVSGDGSVAFGAHFDSAGNDVMRWTAPTGNVDLGFNASVNQVPIPRAATYDGDIFVGNYGLTSFVWRVGTEPRTVEEILTQDFGIDLHGLQLTFVADMSADGRVLVGTGTPAEGGRVGWVVTLGHSIPAPSTGLALAAAALFASRRRRV